MNRTAAEWHRAFLDEEREKLALEAEAEKRDVKVAEALEIALAAQTWAIRPLVACKQVARIVIILQELEG